MILMSPKSGCLMTGLLTRYAGLGITYLGLRSQAMASGSETLGLGWTVKAMQMNQEQTFWDHGSKH